MATKLKTLDEVVTSQVCHGLVTYLGTNRGNLLMMNNSTGAVTTKASVGDAIISMSIDHPSKVRFATNRGEIYYHDISLIDDPAGWAIFKAGGPITSAGGDTTEVITVPDLIETLDISLVEHHTSDDNDQIVAQVVGPQKITITGSADPSTAHKYVYAALRQGAIGDFDVVAAGTHTTAGGAAAEDITIAGVLATDLAFATYSATNDTDTIASVAAAAGKITVTMSADPSTAHGLHYCVLAPKGSRKPTHYVAFAGLHTTVGGAAAEAITITGLLATDIPIVKYGGTNDTDSILKAVATADTLTVTMSADPSTAHKLAYMILRAL